MRRTLVIGFAVLLVSVTAHSQTTMPPNRLVIQPDTASRRDVRDLGAIDAFSTPLDDMKGALRDLVVAEETYFSAHHVYTADGKALDVLPAKHGQAQARVTFIGRNSWSGAATAPLMKRKSCVVYVGLVKELPTGAPKTIGGTVAKEEGVPVCDEP